MSYTDKITTKSPGKRWSLTGHAAAGTGLTISWRFGSRSCGAPPGRTERSDSLQNRFPGARFTLAEPPRTVGNAIRAFWHFGPPGNPRAVSGMDFVILDGEKRATSTPSLTTRAAAASRRTDWPG